MTTTEILTCRACAEYFVWEPGRTRRPHYCTREACVRRRAVQRSLQYQSRKRADAAAAAQGTAATCAVCGTAFAVLRKGQRTCGLTCGWVLAKQARALSQGWEETETRVEALLRAAKAKRLAEERATGRRRYTIETGWQQRPDAPTPFERASDGEGW